MEGSHKVTSERAITRDRFPVCAASKVHTREKKVHIRETHGQGHISNAPGQKGSHERRRFTEVLMRENHNKGQIPGTHPV